MLSLPESHFYFYFLLSIRGWYSVEFWVVGGQSRQTQSTPLPIRFSVEREKEMESLSELSLDDNNGEAKGEEENPNSNPNQTTKSCTQPKPNIVVIMGATGSGKSRLAIDLASHFPIEIINADSMQVCFFLCFLHILISLYLYSLMDRLLFTSIYFWVYLLGLSRIGCSHQ